MVGERPQESVYAAEDMLCGGIMWADVLETAESAEVWEARRNEPRAVQHQKSQKRATPVSQQSDLSPLALWWPVYLHSLLLTQPLHSSRSAIKNGQLQLIRHRRTEEESVAAGNPRFYCLTPLTSQKSLAPFTKSRRIQLSQKSWTNIPANFTRWTFLSSTESSVSGRETDVVRARQQSMNITELPDSGTWTPSICLFDVGCHRSEWKTFAFVWFLLKPSP
ncbi:hypothetical protein BDN72DRAFT_844989 [Pluteus cervinus]|uniref:Uncharacterized protein n=1 Tax=Pluteus cervinus TaxID=181527 RepID=A0ACD3ALZ9_9AGAR|nr:hypothetical protein BDN72DRAFT_844989 [Pluteus cervinus]